MSTTTSVRAGTGSCIDPQGLSRRGDRQDRPMITTTQTRAGGGVCIDPWG
jgi:hypothetical protein